MAREERRRTAKNVAVPTNSNITELLREHIRIILLYREPLGSNLKVKSSLLWPGLGGWLLTIRTLARA